MPGAVHTPRRLLIPLTLGATDAVPAGLACGSERGREVLARGLRRKLQGRQILLGHVELQHQHSRVPVSWAGRRFRNRVQPFPAVS
eukprot:COSAG01_NODE_12888_length_1669_cov_1.203185_2_plen_85_part_01